MDKAHKYYGGVLIDGEGKLVPFADERKRWIKAALAPCKLNEMQTAIVTMNMLDLMFQRELANDALDMANKCMERLSNATDKVYCEEWSSQGDKNKADAIIGSVLRGL